MSAREEILQRLRGAAAPAAAAPDHPDAGAPRPQGEELLQLFRRKSLAQACSCDSVADAGQAPAAIAAWLRRQQLPLQLVGWPDLAGLDWRNAGLDFSARAARGDDLVGVSGCFCAIAETGTLMLCSSADTPATVSLLPETHIAIVAASSIVATMEEAWALLRTAGGAPRAVNFISGPSRTADIEQTIVLGAHGPYRVHLVISGDDAASAATAPAAAAQ